MKVYLYTKILLTVIAAFLVGCGGDTDCEVEVPLATQ